MRASKYFRVDFQALRAWIKYSENYYLRFLIDLLDPKENELTLDDGCGNGRFSVAIAEKGADVIALDLNKSLIKVTAGKAKGFRGKIAPVVGDIQNLPFRPSVFHKVLCVHNLWVVPNYKMAIQEMFRTLKDNGEVLIDQLNLLNWKNLLTQLVYILRKILRRNPMPLFYRHPRQILKPFKAFRSEMYTLNSGRTKRLSLSKGKKILAQRIIVKGIKSSLNSTHCQVRQTP